MQLFGARGHRAVGTTDMKIIIYGGRNIDASTIYDDLLELDTTTLTWKTIQPAGIAIPPGLFGHTMTLVGTNIIITYGFMSAENFNTISSNIFILDSITYTWRQRRRNSYFTAPYESNQSHSPPLTGNLPFNQLPNSLTSNKNTSDHSTSSLPIPPPHLLPPSTLKKKTSSDCKLAIVDSNDVHRNPLRRQFSVDDYRDNPYQPSPLTLPSTLKNKNSSDSNKLTIDDPNDVSKGKYRVDDYPGNPYQPHSSYLQADNDRLKAPSIATSSIYAPSCSSSTKSSHIGSTLPKIDTQLNSITELGNVTPTNFTTTTSPTSDVIAAINAVAKKDSHSSNGESFQSPLFRNEALSLRTARRLSEAKPKNNVDHDTNKLSSKLEKEDQ
ncbi:21295_t:CDS:2 [Entrophospora sp. SA101]|nr:21295_t:CDS:2 [Entrophospora sp. SA101]